MRTRVRQELDEALQACTVLVGPSTTAPAFRLGSVIQDPLAMYKADMTTVALNLAGALQGGLLYGIKGVGLRVQGLGLLCGYSVSWVRQLHCQAGWIRCLCWPAWSAKCTSEVGCD